ncbi:MAG: hypothetical protein PHF05_08885 [Candidatus Izemoplasmatales bacterium]|nr:hypothetical protein [Candidatus Izemoplasmatales bacterium]
MTYKKITDNIFIPATNTPDPILLSDLEQELEDLRASILSEPTDSELLDWARTFHPYFTENGVKELMIQEKEELINYLKSL